jgi:Ca-activated chloride channel family protein
LIAYAGDAHIVTPLTDDTLTIANLLPALSPDMMPVPGSNTAAAISQAIDLMYSAGISQGQIVLITDGVDKSARLEVEKALRGSGMQLSILAVGTPLGAPIPLARGGFLKDASGAIVIPKLELRPLQALASATGGRLLNIQINESDIDQLMDEPLLPGQEQILALDRTADTWDDQGYLFVLLLLPLVLPLFRRGCLLCLLPAMLLSTPEQARAQTWDDLWFTPDQQGQRALQQGDHEAAANLFENPEWAGTAAYSGEDFETAAKLFSSGENSNDWYNRGNALAKAGHIDEAIEAYQESLTRQPDQKDAIENLELLEQLKQEQEQQQQQDGEGENQPEDQNQQQSGDQNESDQQGDPDEPDEPQEGEQNPSDQQPSDDQSDNSQDPSESEDESESPAKPEDEQQDPSETGQEETPAQAQETSPEDQEEDQAMQQWLRRIPDDPSGLLREKFKYESRQRKEQGNGRSNETYW